MDLKGSAYASLIFIFVLLGIFLISPQQARSQESTLVSCRITTGSLDVNESIVFTFENSTGGTLNAHGAEAEGDGGYRHKVVCKGLDRNSFQEGCPTGESSILSFSNWTNAHVEEAGTGNYDWEACGRVEDPDTGINVLTARVRPSCDDGEEVVSLQNADGGTANAHLAEPGVYDNQLCLSGTCEGSSCLTVRSTTTDAFSPTGQYVIYDVELFNFAGNETIRGELYLENEDEYTGSDSMFGQYGDWDFLFTNETGDYYPAQVSVNPGETKTVQFKVRAPSRAPPSSDLAPYEFTIAVRDP